jgi:hypothetical protein
LNTENLYLAALAIGSIWVAIAALTWLLARTLGWTGLKQHLLPFAILVIALAGLPGAAALKLAMPYKSRILAMVLRKKSPPIVFPAGCSMLPANNIWNIPVAALPVDPNSAAWVQSMGRGLPLHADFGLIGGIPYNVVATANHPATSVEFSEGAAESDPGPYRIPDDARLEEGADRHVLVVDTALCRLYELYLARRLGPQRWQASSGATFDLRGNQLRQHGWTSADAAGLPILPGLVRYDEVKSGSIRHALRFTTRRTRRAFVWPARHYASRSTDPRLPPMGQRFRLRASFDARGLHPETQVILTALKEYGMVLADNGGNWFLTGTPDSRWSSRVIRELRTVTGADFEAVDSSALMLDQNSGGVR